MQGAGGLSEVWFMHRSVVYVTYVYYAGLGSAISRSYKTAL